MNLEKFEKIEAIKLLLEETGIAIIENSVVLKRINNEILIAKNIIAKVDNHEITLNKINNLTLGMKLRNLVEMELYKDILNRKFFFKQLQQLEVSD